MVAAEADLAATRVVSAATWVVSAATPVVLVLARVASPATASRRTAAIGVVVVLRAVTVGDAGWGWGGYGLGLGLGLGGLYAFGGDYPYYGNCGPYYNNYDNYGDCGYGWGW